MVLLCALQCGAKSVTVPINSAALWGLQNPATSTGVSITSSTNPSVSMKYEGVVLTAMRSGGAQNPVIWNKNEEFTFRNYSRTVLMISCPNEIITEIRLKGVEKKLNYSANVGRYEVSGDEAAWSGYANSISFTANEMTQIESVEVIYGDAPLVAPVEFSPEGGSFYYSAMVTLSCLTEGATIYYQFTNDWDDAQVYTNPIKLESSTTIYARAIKDGEVSWETSANFKIVKMDAVKDFNEMYELHYGKNFVYINDAKVMFVHDKFMVLTDGTRFALVEGDTGQQYEVGDVIKSGFSSRFMVSGGVGRMIEPFSDFAPAQIKATLPNYRRSRTVADILHNFAKDNMFYYPVELMAVELTDLGNGRYLAKDAKGEFMCFNEFGVDIQPLKEGVIYNVKGFASAIDGENMLMIASVEIGEVVSPVEFSVPAGHYTSERVVKLSTATPGAIIYYQTTGSWDDTQIYNAPITVSENTTITALALKGTNISDETSATYRIEPVDPLLNIGDVYRLSVDTDFMYAANVKVVFAKDNNTIVTDGTRYMQIFGYLDQNYVEGDIIPGGFLGKYSLFTNVGQLSSPFGFKSPLRNEGPIVFQKVDTMSPILTSVDNNDMYFSPVEFTNVSLEVDGKNVYLFDEYGSFYCYNQYGVEIPQINQETKFNVKGVATMYWDVYQVNLTEVVESSGVNVVKTNQNVEIRPIAGGVEIDAIGDLIISSIDGNIAVSTKNIERTAYTLPSGIYIVRIANRVEKVVVK